MKNMLKIFLLLTALTSIVACNAQSTSAEHRPSNEETITTAKVDNVNSDIDAKKNIVLYMKAHDLSGLEQSSESDAYYYRVLIKELPNNRYLVQDFFISGEKFTNPYILTDGKLEYTDNEDVTHLNNYYPIEGARIVWSESGDKEIESNYKNNMPTDTWIEYFENGQKKSEDHYKDGVLHGTSKSWNEQGVLTGECNYDHGIKNGRCYAKYSLSPDIYIYDFKYKNGKKIGISKSWNIDGTIEEFIFNGPLSLQEIEKDLAKNQFKIFTLDVTADGIDDLVISRINDNANLYQGDELYVLTGDKGGKYKLSLETSSFTDDGGFFLAEILPRPNNNGFSLSTYFSSKGFPFKDYYFILKNNKWHINSFATEGYLANGKEYYCIDNQEFSLQGLDSRTSSLDKSDNEILQDCPPLPIKYTVKKEKAEILDESFELRTKPNYYIKGDLIEAFDQNEDWVKVSYKNATKFGWIDKRDLSPALN